VVESISALPFEFLIIDPSGFTITTQRHQYAYHTGQFWQFPDQDVFSYKDHSSYPPTWSCPSSHHTFMQPTIRRLPTRIRLSKITNKITTITPNLVSCCSTQAPKMSVFFPHITSVHPIFRFVDELEKATRHSGQQQCQPVRSFSPRFDVKETKDGYELQGDLPGVDQSNVNIEWSDEHTLAISGNTEQASQVVSDDKNDFVEVTEAGEEAEVASESYHKPTVEEEGSENTTGDAAVSASKKEVTPTKPQHKYWVSERSAGSFRRTFTFPGRVDQENVKASLKNGVLSITIPKAKPLEPRRIVIN
jgi:HSP20 family protein